MKNKFNNAMNLVYPNDEQKQQMFEKAISLAELNKEDRKQHKNIKNIFFGIIIIVTITAITVFAYEIKNVL